MSRTTFHLEPVPPFRLDLTVWTLRRRPDNAVDRWDGQTYRRVLHLMERGFHKPGDAENRLGHYVGQLGT
jgi:hypothetical protein